MLHEIGHILLARKKYYNYLYPAGCIEYNKSIRRKCDRINILQEEWRNVKCRKGYMIVSITRKNRTQLYDNTSLDALMLNLPTTRVDSIRSDSLYIENKTVRRISITAERNREFYEY